VPPTRPALRERYEAKRRDVVLAAARLFADRGLERASMQDLVAATGLAAGGLYHYIGSKEELARTICDDLVEPLLDQARELVAQHDDPERRLRELVRMWTAHVVEHKDHMLVFDQVRHVAERDPDWRGVRRTRKAFEDLVEGCLRDVDLRPEVPPRVALSALLGAVNSTAQWYRPRGPLTPDEIADGYVGLVLR
jgi:TetR/AcrR family transcriptional regulator, cholesterol catabolism regulator